MILLIQGKNNILMILIYILTKIKNTIRYGHQALIANQLLEKRKTTTKSKKQKEEQVKAQMTTPQPSGTVKHFKPLTQCDSNENLLIGIKFAQNINRDSLLDLYRDVSYNYTFQKKGYSIIRNFQNTLHDHIYNQRKYGISTQNPQTIVEIVHKFCEYNSNNIKQRKKRSMSEFKNVVLTNIYCEINIEESKDLLENVGIKIHFLQNDDLNWFKQLYEIYTTETETLREPRMEFEKFVEVFDTHLNDVIPAEYELLNNIEAKNYFKKIIGIALEKLNNDSISIDSSVLRNQCQLITSDYDCEHNLKLWIELSSLVMYKLCPAIQICYVTPRQTMSKYLTVQMLRNCHHLLSNAKRNRHYRFCIHKNEKCALKLSPILISER